MTWLQASFSCRYPFRAPLAVLAAPVNKNEKKHAPMLLEKVVKAING